MDHSIRPRAPFTLRNKHTAQECEFHDQAEVDNFRAEVEDASAWELVVADGNPATIAPAAEAQPETAAASEAPAAAPAVNEEAPAPTEAPAPARKPRTAKK